MGVTKQTQEVPQSEEVHLTTEEVAQRYRTSPETVRYWRAIGKGPRSWRLGRRVLYALEDVRAFEAAARDAGPSDAA